MDVQHESPQQYNGYDGANIKNEPIELSGFATFGYGTDGNFGHLQHQSQANMSDGGLLFLFETLLIFTAETDWNVHSICFFYVFNELDTSGVWYGDHVGSNIPEQNLSNLQQKWDDDDKEEYGEETEMTNMSSNDSDLMELDTNGNMLLLKDSFENK